MNRIVQFDDCQGPDFHLTQTVFRSSPGLQLDRDLYDSSNFTGILETKLCPVWPNIKTTSGSLRE